MGKKCKYFEKCPIYSGVLIGKESKANNYKKVYCETDEGWNNCKRFIVKEQTGRCPFDLLPNSFKEIEDIIKEMKIS